MPPTYGLSLCGLPMFVLDSVNLGFFLPLRSFLCLGSSMLAWGVVRPGSSILVLDFLHLGSFPPLQGLARLDFGLSMYGVSRLESLSSVFGPCAHGLLLVFEKL